MNQPTYGQTLTPVNNITRRRKLLPWWVIGFTWVFLLFGVTAPVTLILGVLGYTFQLSALGLATNEPLSITGFAVMLILAFKGWVAYGLWTEKEWAVRWAKLDAILSVVICVATTLTSLLTPGNLNLRLEFILIIPYYFKINNIQYDWENFELENKILIEE
ncbi:hypothetical protein [Mucilaginibacter aquatilis]|uniref:Uncharacterized protein n=1 Tax=Mucilaginibacter aquatilis TaxID=1517760 RepID=A0A6I4IA97_9SPHI|nr:hypothetical protein [Mucilaginibacter aquatilis]MVN92022.1 hypothetical protein [Mucilaginibacter aquatilis]